MIHLSSVLFVYFLLYFEQKNYVKQYNNIQDEVYLTIPKSKKTHLKTGFWKLEFMEQQAEIAAKRRQITGRFEEKYIHTALTLPNCLDYIRTNKGKKIWKPEIFLASTRQGILV